MTQNESAAIPQVTEPGPEHQWPPDIQTTTEHIRHAYLLGRTFAERYMQASVVRRHIIKAEAEKWMTVPAFCRGMQDTIDRMEAKAMAARVLSSPTAKTTPKPAKPPKQRRRVKRH